MFRFVTHCAVLLQKGLLDACLQIQNQIQEQLKLIQASDTQLTKRTRMCVFHQNCAATEHHVDSNQCPNLL